MEKRPFFDQILPLVDARDPQSAKSVAQSLGITLNSLNVSLIRLRERLARCLREEVSATMADPAPGQEIDGRSDQYSLATSIWELLTGELPMGSFPRLRGMAKSAPAWLDGVLRKAMSPAPADRYPDITAFTRALTGVPARRRRLALVLAGAAILAALAFGLSRLEPPPTDAPQLKHFQSKSLPVVKRVRVFVKLDLNLQPDGLIKMIVITRSDEALRGMKTRSAVALLDRNGKARQITDVRYLTHPGGGQPYSPWYREYPDVPKQDAKSLLVIVEDDHVGRPKTAIPGKLEPAPPVD